MDRKIRLRITLDHEHTAEYLSAHDWDPVVPPDANATDVDVERTFANDDDFVQGMAMIRQGSFLVLEAAQEDPDYTFYRLDVSGGKLGAEETLLGAVVRLVSETRSGGGGVPNEQPETTAPTVKPKPPEAPAPPAAISQEVMTGVPTIPDAVWTSLDKPDAAAAAKTLVEKATTFETDRTARAAWTPTRENALMAHVDPPLRADVAKRLLEESGGITEGHVTARAERNLMLKAAVDVTTSINDQLKRWTELSQLVVPLLAAMSLAGFLLILVCLDLLRAGRVNGTEMALLAFVFTLAAVSPATLLLIGRPLKGLDQWSPTGAKAEEAAPKADAGGKPPAGRSTEAPKAGS
jgi:hypothetical protein